MVAPKIPGILIGVWTLLNNTPTDKDGNTGAKPPATGFYPAGLLHYSPAGYMSVNIASQEPASRPPGLTWPPSEGESDADWAIIGRETLAYAGNFSVAEGSNQKSGTAYHGPLSVAHTPSWTGTKQVRNYTVYEEERDGGKRVTVLRLWSKNQVTGSQANIWWEKIA